MKFRILQNIKPLIVCLTFIINISNSLAEDLDVPSHTIILDEKSIDNKPGLLGNEYNQEEVKKTINDATIEAKQNQENAKKSLIEANKIVQKSNSAELIKMAKNQAIIEQSRKDIAKLQILLTENLQKTNEDLNKISLSIDNIESAFLNKEMSLLDLENLYWDLIFNWRILVDNSLMVFSKKNSDLEIKIDSPSDLLYKIPPDIEDKNLITKYQDSYELLQKEYAKILQLKTELNRSNKNYQSNLLLKAGQLRANILQRILEIDATFIKYDNNYAEDLIRELKLIPYRPIAVFYSKILQYKQAIDSGFTGFVYILKQLALLLMLVIVVLLSKAAFTKLHKFFNAFSQFCIKKSSGNKLYSKLSVFLSRITPYFKWLVLSLIFGLASVILENTLFSEIGTLIPYFQYYFSYKVFRLFVHYNLTSIAYYNKIDDSSLRYSLNRKIRKTTKLIGIYLLGSVFIIHLTQAVVRKAYFYNLTASLFLFGLLLVLAIIASSWKLEIRSIAQHRLSKRYFRIINKLLSSKKGSLLFSLIILCLLIAIELTHGIIFFLKNYDLFKNILSQIYRRKLESAAKKLENDNEIEISDSYLNKFSNVDDEGKFIYIKDHPYDKIKNIIDRWKLDKSEENSISIYGEKGIGKSRFLKKIILDNGDFKIVHTKFEKKITSKEELIKILSELFNKEMKEKNLFEFLANFDKKIIIILDDCHNLFLAKEGGFEALKLLFNFLVKIDNPNLLWISTFNSFSWHYLKNSLKINNYFRQILKLSRWSDENIRELIMDKHNKTGFTLTYDPLIFAVNTSRSEKEFEDLQLKFFQIIWSQSRGNPSIAIFLWLSSLNQAHSNNIKISLPKTIKASHVNNLSDDHLFVYSVIIKHQDLLISEISTILSIAKEEALNIIRIGLEKGYLEESAISNKRFNISREWQITINRLLINRNFIYAE